MFGHCIIIHQRNVSIVLLFFEHHFLTELLQNYMEHFEKNKALMFIFCSRLACRWRHWAFQCSNELIRMCVFRQQVFSIMEFVYWSKQEFTLGVCQSSVSSLSCGWFFLFTVCRFAAPTTKSPAPPLSSRLNFCSTDQSLYLWWNRLGLKPLLRKKRQS